MFSDKPGKLRNKVHLEVDPLVPPVVHPPRKIPSTRLNQHERSSRRWKKMGLLLKKRKAPLGFHLC